MEAKNLIKTEHDLNTIASIIVGSNHSRPSSDPLYEWKDGYRVAERALIEVIERLIKENKQLAAIRMPLSSEDLLERIKTLEHIIANKEQIIRDSRGMVDTSFLVLCEKNELIRDTRVFLTRINEMFEFDGLDELMGRLK